MLERNSQSLGHLKCRNKQLKTPTVVRYIQASRMGPIQGMYGEKRLTKEYLQRILVAVLPGLSLSILLCNLRKRTRKTMTRDTYLRFLQDRHGIHAWLYIIFIVDKCERMRMELKLFSGTFIEQKSDFWLLCTFPK